MRQILYNTMNDSQLWELLLQGELPVLEVLYKRNYDLLLNYGLKYSSDKELVKDCIHDIFIKLHQSKTLSFTPCPRSYLVKALRNILFDKLTSLKEQLGIEEFVFSIPNSTDLFETLFPKSDEDIEFGKQLLEAMSHLSDNQRNVLYLRYVKDFSYNEIAEVLDINVQSSMNLASRSLKKLRKLLTDNELRMCELVLILNLLY